MRRFTGSAHPGRSCAAFQCDDEELCFNGQPFLKRSQIKLRGMHNVENVMAAALIAHLAGASLDALGSAVESFPGVEHRIEFVRETGRRRILQRFESD